VDHPVAEFFLALLLSIPVVGGATLTHQQTELCAHMGGTFTPSPTPPPYNQPNVCPGGSWVAWWRYVSKPK
jgi:hypothetical protein